MTIADKNSATVWFKCPWCPNIFLTQHDLDAHLTCKAFRVLGKEPNQFDHVVMWKSIMHYRLKVEPYEKGFE